MGVLFGSLTSLFIGLSDLFLVSITKRSHIVTVVVMAFVSAGLVGLVGTVFIAGDLTGRDMALGAGSGVLMAFALVFYFTGIQRSSVGIVAPLIALQIALWPLFYDVVDGARPSALVWVGVGVAIVSLLLTTISPDLGDRVWVGLRWGLMAGTLYGIGTLLGGLTSEASGMWSVVANRFSSLIVAVIVAAIMGLPVLVPRRDLPAGAVGGVFGGLALLSYVYGTQRYDLAIVGVTGSLFPAVSAYLMYRFLGHPLRWWQGVGIAGVLAGTSLIALG
ncbi:MAG: DMT family transporter [Acidimicrobiaceae bacterium]